MDRATSPLHPHGARPRNVGAIRHQQDFVCLRMADNVAVSTRFFVDLRRWELKRVPIDESCDHYLYAAAADPVVSDQSRDAHHHGRRSASSSGRPASRAEVGEAFDFRGYPDAEAEVRAGSLASAQQHFGRCGCKEARLPRVGWSLPASP
jgi:hypothetical protein